MCKESRKGVSTTVERGSGNPPGKRASNAVLRGGEEVGVAGVD